MGQGRGSRRIASHGLVAPSYPGLRNWTRISEVRFQRREHRCTHAPRQPGKTNYRRRTEWTVRTGSSFLASESVNLWFVCPQGLGQYGQ
jgi:hypothetical protein